jgi:hypothetical protein
MIIMQQQWSHEMLPYHTHLFQYFLHHLNLQEVILIVLKIIIIYGIVPNKIMKSHTSNYDLCLLLYRVA